MEEAALHLEVRNAIALSDELRRYEHALGNDTLAGHLAALQTSLDRLERAVGVSHAAPTSAPAVMDSIGRSLTTLRDRCEEVPMNLRPRFGQLLSTVERVMFAERQPEAPVPARSVTERLPVKRVVPQDAHSLVDYFAAGAYLASAALARTRRGRTVGVLLGGGLGGVSALSDDRLAARRLIPMEDHQIVDHVSGLLGVVAPLTLGYVKRDPLAAAIQMATGALTIAVALFTDFRASRGLARPRRSRGGPKR